MKPTQQKENKKKKKLLLDIVTKNILASSVGFIQAFLSPF